MLRQIILLRQGKMRGESGDFQSFSGADPQNFPGLVHPSGTKPIHTDIEL